MKLSLKVFLIVSLVIFPVLSFAEDNISWQIEEYLEGFLDAYFNARYQKAIDACEDALIVIEKKFGPGHANTAAILTNLGNLYKIQKKYNQAEKFYKKALEIYESSMGIDNIYTASVWNALGENYQSRRKFNEAEGSFNNAQQVLAKSFGVNAPGPALVGGQLGILYKEQRKYKEAEAILISSLQSAVGGYGEGHPILIHMVSAIGKLYEAMGQELQAEQYYRYAWWIFKNNFFQEDATIDKAFNRLKSESDKLWSQRNDPIYKRLLNINDLYVGPWHPEAPDIIENLPMLYAKQKRYVEAENIYEDALELMLSNLGSNHLNISKVFDNMAKFYRKIDKPDKAKESLEKARLIREKNIHNK